MQETHYHCLPSLNGLKFFEAAARHLSFTRAARELNVTQGAVSRQIKLGVGRVGRPERHTGFPPGKKPYL